MIPKEDKEENNKNILFISFHMAEEELFESPDKSSSWKDGWIEEWRGFVVRLASLCPSDPIMADLQVFYQSMANQ